MEIRKARPSGDSHGLAYFHLRRYNFLPAERELQGYNQTFFAFKGETIYAVLTWLLIVFPNCPLFLYSHEFIRQLYFEHLHLTVDHRLGNLRIGLRRGDAFMPQHLRYGFQRYALRERDRRGKCMPGHMDRRIERQPACLVTCRNDIFNVL